MAKKGSHKILELKLDKMNARFAQGNLDFMPTHTHTHTHIYTLLLKSYLQIIYQRRGLYTNYIKNTYNSISNNNNKKHKNGKRI